MAKLYFVSGKESQDNAAALAAYYAQFYSNTEYGQTQRPVQLLQRKAFQHPGKRNQFTFNIYILYVELYWYLYTHVLKH